MKKALSLTLILLLSTFTLSHAFFGSKMGKARDLIKVERYQEAHKILDQILVDNPTDAGDYFDVGKAYLDMGWNGQAEKTFGILVRKLDGTYGNKVASLFMAKGDTNRAMKFDPSLKADIARDAFSKGKYDEALRLSPSLKPEICNDLMTKADKANDEDCIDLYKKAERYCDKGSERFKKAGKRLETIANQIEKVNVVDPRVRKYLEQAKKYNGDVRPYLKEYGPGFYPFPLKKGETNGHWIAPIAGRRTDFMFSSTKGSKFEIILDNGKVVKICDGEKMPSAYSGNMMIRALEDSKIFLEME